MTTSQFHPQPTPTFVIQDSAGFFFHFEPFEAHWVTDPSLATPFQTVTEAFEVAEAAHAADFHVVNVSH